MVSKRHTLIWLWPSLDLSPSSFAEWLALSRTSHGCNISNYDFLFPGMLVSLKAFIIYSATGKGIILLEKLKIT